MTPATPAREKPVHRALISVADKRGVADFARRLHAAGAELVSTGGTACALQDAGLPVTAVEQITGFPEILDGRVKTLHPALHAGILARRDRPEHLATLAALNLERIDLVCANLYPFEETVRGGADPDAAGEQIDIGGPALLRAAAKNHAGVVTVVEPADYPRVAAAVEAGEVPAAQRRRLAGKAFAHTAVYDAVIATFFAERTEDDPWPARLALPLTRVAELRYGENPHQRGALYTEVLHEDLGLAGAEQLQGKELSYNNLQDAAAAWEAVQAFDAVAAVAVKHTNPCGVAVGRTPREAVARARAADPVSIFGGIVALNRPLDADTATALTDLFLEVVLAPAVEEDARDVLGRRKNLRVLAMPPRGRDTGRLPARLLRSIPGGLLAQTPDATPDETDAWRVASGSAPAALEQDVRFAWTVVRHVKSNAIVVARDGATLGIGAGQMNRVQAARIALDHAGEAAEGAVMASDAFLPFPDTVEVCAERGIAAIVQPGGSVRDEQVVAAAEQAEIAMIFTGRRHFRH